MSSQAAITREINELLSPYLFQVVGSTPESLRDAIVNSGLRGQTGPGIKLASLCVFASAVVKSAVESLSVNPSMLESRPFITNTLTINGKINMTAMTLFGHCLLTSPYMDSIEFAVAFRRKMGQDHLWAGDLSNSSLSDTQRKILLEKVKVANQQSAKALASGYLKYIGADNTPYTRAERDFWNIPSDDYRSHTRTGSDTSPPSRSRGGSSRGGGNIIIPITDTSNTTRDVELPEDVVEWYRRVVTDDPNRLAASVAKRGRERWIAEYRAEMLANPNAPPTGGTSVVG